MPKFFLGCSQGGLCAGLSRKRVHSSTSIDLPMQRWEHDHWRAYILNFKGIWGNLAAVGSPVIDKVEVFSLPTILGAKYESFTTTMLKPHRPIYTELVSLLQRCEDRQKLVYHQWNNSSFSLLGQKQHPQQYTSTNQRSQNHFNSNSHGFLAHNQNFNNQKYSNNQGHTSFSW